MYAIAFDLKVGELRKNYSDNYNGAYTEIRRKLEKLGFFQSQGSLYIGKNNDNAIANLYVAIHKLSEISWFRKSVSSIKTFKIEECTDFTGLVKNNWEFTGY